MNLGVGRTVAACEPAVITLQIDTNQADGEESPGFTGQNAG